MGMTLFRWLFARTGSYMGILVYSPVRCHASCGFRIFWPPTSGNSGRVPGGMKWPCRPGARSVTPPAPAAGTVPEGLVALRNCPELGAPGCLPPRRGRGPRRAGGITGRASLLSRGRASGSGRRGPSARIGRSVRCACRFPEFDPGGLRRDRCHGAPRPIGAGVCSW